MSEGLSIRVELADGVRVGPGKIALLEAIAATGSIAAAARQLRMSYKRAWDLTEYLNRSFAVPLVAAAAGGARGGGAGLTAQGHELVAHYRGIEAAAASAAAGHLAALAGLGK